ncbi:MAG: hypothetical protein H7Y03_01585 [Chitinophagaceae bacterium]|nr:hypothetical protein [Chitinophagaceae bacterium]
MKKILLLIVIAGSSLSVMSQAREGTLEYLKTQQPAAIIEFPYAPEVVEGAIKSEFEKQGAKISSSKGLLIVKNASVETGQEKQILDLYFKIERKSRKDKDISIVYLTLGRAGENIAARTASDRYGVTESKTVLNSFAPSIENHSLGLQIIDQEEVIKKANKKYSGLQEDSVDYYKRKLALEQKMTDNSKQQNEQRIVLERQRQVLEALKVRKKP